MSFKIKGKLNSDSKNWRRNVQNNVLIAFSGLLDLMKQKDTRD